MPDYNVLLITIDSLRRDFLSTYAAQPTVCDYPVATPNLDRFAERATVFDTHYAGSLPCMPQRREFLCGIREFLWRPWGPAEPFDRTVPAVAGEADITTGLITDHYHYFEHGAHGYYEDFHGFEFVRGHEHDHWKTAPRWPDHRLLAQDNRHDVDHDDVPPGSAGAYARNVAGLDELDERDFFAPRVFTAASTWLRDNAAWDRWFCYVDSFDVHEPFHCPEPYASMYTDEDPTDPELVVWPDYAPVADQGLTDRQLDFVISQFAGKVTMVDRWFGRVLDRLDRLGAWDETIVIVTTDHGELLGEHGYIMKNYMPVYDPIAHTPLLIAHPEGGPDRIDALTSAVDLYPTMLEGLGRPIPAHTHGQSLLPLARGHSSDHRDYALYGYFGADACITDGQYTYFHPGRTDTPVTIYSTMQLRQKSGPATPATMPHADVAVWRYHAGQGRRQADGPRLYDTASDPGQTTDLCADRPAIAGQLRTALIKRLQTLEVPAAQYDRFGLTEP